MSEPARVELGLSAYVRLTGRVLRAREAALIVCLGFIIASLEVAGLFLLLPLLALVGVEATAGGAASLTLFTRQVFDSVGIPITLSSVLAAYVAVIALQASVAHMDSVASVRVRESTAARLRILLHSAIVRMSWRSLTEQPTAHYVNALTTQLNRVYLGISYALVLVAQVMVALVYVAVAMRLQPWVSTVAIASGAALMLVTQRYTRRLRTSGDELTVASQRLHALIVEHLAAVKVAKAFAMEAEHSRHFSVASSELAASWSHAGAAFAGTRTIFTVGTAATLAVVVYVSVGLFGLGSAAVLLLLYAFARLVPRLAAIQHTAQQIAHSRGAFDATILELTRCERAAEGQPPEGSDRLRLQREIRLRDVVVAYSGRGEALRGVSAVIRAGAITAIVGQSGAGKTTFADVILGLMTPDAGEVSIDAAALSSATIQAWRRSVAYVPQDAVLFNDTIRANLLLISPRASEEQLRSALAAARADFVFDFPGGLDTVVGERGVFLSGGERQRIALALAFLRDPDLLVLDEAMSQIDSITEHAIMQVLSDQKERMAVLLISHRLKNLQAADQIYVLEDGRIVEQGSWHELSRSGLRFRELLTAAQA